jgi:hypothetical protein
MSLQTELNKIVAFMREQGKPAYDGAPGIGGCRYRAEDGSKCAVGCRISDEQFERFNLRKHNGTGVFSLARELFEELAQLTETNEGLLLNFYANMQRAHDQSAFNLNEGSFGPGEWLGEFERNARAVADTYELVYPEPA